MKKTAYPGTFDPITYGHLDILQRALELFDEVLVLVANNPDKRTFLNFNERFSLVQGALDEFFSPPVRSRISLYPCKGLLVDALRKHKVRLILRGLRAVSDYEYELQMALMNRKLQPGVETIFLTASPEFSFLSSSLVKELAQMGADISPFVPACVAKKLRQKFSAPK